MTTTPPIAAELTAGPWRVVFSQRGDRFEHEICLVGNPCVPVLKSLEGDDLENWPPSPPLQQLHLETQPAGPVALLVGMAGKSHWSLSCQANLAGEFLEFDVACRVHHRPQRLGSQYEITLPSAQATFFKDRLLLKAATTLPALKLSWNRDSEHKASTAADQFSEVCESPRSIVVPAASAEGDFPQTIRWRYTLQSFSTPDQT